MRLIPYKGEPAGEVRKAYFIKAFGMEKEDLRIVSFGRCNFSCPYCKRDAQFIDSSGNVLTSKEFDNDKVYSVLEDGIKAGQRVRLSGGDPSMHLEDSLAIARWSVENHGKKISICHNASSPKYVEAILPYIEYAAIDLKASDPEEFSMRAGITVRAAAHMIERFFAIEQLFADADILVDVRTMVFSETALDDLYICAQHILRHANPARTFWTIRQYTAVAGVDWAPLPVESLREWISHISREYPNLHIGMRKHWENNGLEYWTGGAKQDNL